MSNTNSEVYTDISIIINMMPAEMKNKISSNFISFIENNKSDKYVSNIDPKIPLKEQNIRKETKEILGIIYRDYLCDEKEREELIKKNNKKIEEMNNTYDIKNVFEKRSNNIKEINNEKQLIVVKQEKWYYKIFKFFKNIFRKK